MLSKFTIDSSVTYFGSNESCFETVRVVSSSKWSEVTTLALPCASIVKQSCLVDLELRPFDRGTFLLDLATMNNLPPLLTTLTGSQRKHDPQLVIANQILF